MRRAPLRARTRGEVSPAGKDSAGKHAKAHVPADRPPVLTIMKVKEPCAPSPPALRPSPGCTQLGSARVTQPSSWGFYGVKEPDDMAGNGEPPAAFPKSHNVRGLARPHSDPSRGERPAARGGSLTAFCLHVTLDQSR